MRPIDAERLKAVLEKNFGHTGGASVLEQLIDEQPTIEPSTNCSEIPNSSDTVSRQAVIDAIVQCTNCGDEDTLREYVLKHSLDNGWTGGILEALDAVKDLPSAQPVATDTNVGDKISKFIDGLEETFAYIRDREGGDSVCGLCEYDGAYIGESGDWCNECPGFNRDDCFKLSDETRKKWTDEIIKALPTIQPERKKGEWSDGYRWQRCSLCKQTGKKSWNFCPNCGADMRGEKDG